MSQDDLEFRIEYPRFTGREYVVAVYDNPYNRPLWDPTNFFFARWMLSRSTDLKHMLGRWLVGQQSISSGEESYTEYVTEVDGGRKNLRELTEKELFSTVRKRVREVFGSYNLVDSDYRRTFFIGDKTHPDRAPHSGGIVLSAHVKPKRGGNKDARFHRVEITGPFENSRIPFANLSCDCDDFTFTAAKEGYAPIQPGCMDIAATLELARHRPECFGGLEDVLTRNHSKINLPFILPKNQQQYIEHVMVTIFLDFIFKGRTKYEIAQALASDSAIYTPYLVERLEQGKAGFEVIANKYLFAGLNSVPTPVRRWFEQMAEHYRINGFKSNRMVVENKGSPHETIDMEYVKGNEVRRLVFGDFPPLERRIVFDATSKPDIFLLEREEEAPQYVNPYTELFHPFYGREVDLNGSDESRRARLRHFDDASRRMPVFTEYRIPWFIDIPEPMRKDYHTAIEAYFPNGDNGLRRWINVRNGFAESAPYRCETHVTTPTLSRILSGI